MYHFIVNPNARSKRGILVWNELEAYLQEQQVPYRVHLTKCAGDATKMVERLTKEGKERTIIVLGGDGTLNEVLNGIVQMDKVRLGYIPVGSSNDFARGMGIDEAPLVLLKRMVETPKTIPLDYGTVCADGQEKRYLVSSGIGYDAAVCYETNHSKIKNVLNFLRLGKLTYTVIGLKQLLGIPPLEADFQIEEKEVFHRRKMLFTATMLQKYEGGGLKFCPDADPADGLLDICIGSGIWKPRVLGLLPLAYTGRHVGHRGIEILQCKSVEIHLNRPMHIHTDGEAFRTKRGVLHDSAVFRVPDEKINFLDCRSDKSGNIRHWEDYD